MIRIVWGFLFLPLFSWAQLVDDFSDGDFTSNPIWMGDIAMFEVNGQGELQSNGLPASDTIYLSTLNSRLDDTEWRFKLRYNGNPSTSNFMRVYLVSDQSNVNGAVDGYFLQAGGESGADDSYDLYRQDGLTNTLLIDGILGNAGTTVDATVKVLRDATGNWSLYTDTNGSGLFDLEGTAFDDTYVSTAHFGVRVRHTSSLNDAYFFDDFYIGDELIDLEPPSVDSVRVMTSSSLEVYFSEAIDSTSGVNPTAYEVISGIGMPASIEYFSQMVRLNLGTSFINHTSYSLVIKDVADLIGNTMTIPDTVDFEYDVPDTARFRDVVINEIFPDPTPSFGLPDAEYIEIWNTSGKKFNLLNWSLNSGSSKAFLPAYLLEAGDYVILTRSSDTSLFSGYGPVISPSSWAALVNGGDNLGLRSDLGELIDSVDYSESWYGDLAKEEGGFSLELINPDNISCPIRANWTGSASIIGGTPGTVNSVFTDTLESISPEVESVILVAPNRLEVCFNESMDLTSLTSLANYSIDQGIGNAISIIPLNPDLLCVEVSFADSLQVGVLHELSINGVSDCTGNILDGAYTKPLVLGAVPSPFDIVINEFLPDFEPSIGLPESEFVEIYNRTNTVLDISGFQFKDRSRTVSWGEMNILPNEHLIICNEEDSAAFASFGKVILVNGLPSLNNSEDTLYLLNSAETVMDFVFYSDSWYKDEVKSTGGWSLERIDPDFVDCNHENNWAAATASVGGTPGTENSVRGTFNDSQIPFLEGIVLVDENTIKLTFNEQIDVGQLEELQNYGLEPSLGTPMLALSIAPHFREVTLIWDVAMEPNILYTLQINGLTDCAGNIFQGERLLGIPLSPEAGDVLINEILFNPYTGGNDFVEIYNASDKILDLSQLVIGEIFEDSDSVFNVDRLASESLIFLPKELICLTQNVDFQRAIYQPPSEANFLKMSSFPSYDDAKGECVIMFLDSIILDRFYYEDDFHFPTLVEEDGVSLERISLQRPTQDPNNWHSAAGTVGFATPGYRNSQAIEDQSASSLVSLQNPTFSPNGDGNDDVLVINYDFDFTGANARVFIYDAQGRLVRILKQNTLLSPEPGTFLWDGRDDNNQKADIGMYVVLVEVVNDQTGKVSQFREVAVLADQF